MDLNVNARSVFAATGGVDFDSARPVMVFVHGASFDRTVWRLQARYFAWHGYAVLSLDMPGHGRSEGPLIPTIEGMAEWLWQAVDAAGVERAALVGHSLGSFVVLQAAADQPDRVSALSLVGTAFPMPVTDLLLKPAKANEHVAMDRLIAWGYGHNASMGGCATPGLWMTGGGLRILERSGDDVLYNDLNACHIYAAGEAAAAAVSAPVQMVLGELDMMTPLKRARAFAEHFKVPPRIDVIAGAGHIMIDEAPDATLDALCAFHAH